MLLLPKNRDSEIVYFTFYNLWKVITAVSNAHCTEWHWWHCTKSLVVNDSSTLQILGKQPLPNLHSNVGNLVFNYFNGVNNPKPTKLLHVSSSQQVCLFEPKANWKEKIYFHFYSVTKGHNFSKSITSSKTPPSIYNLCLGPPDFQWSYNDDCHLPVATLRACSDSLPSPPPPTSPQKLLIFLSNQQSWGPMIIKMLMKMRMIAKEYFANLQKFVIGWGLKRAFIVVFYFVVPWESEILGPYFMLWWTQ